MCKIHNNLHIYTACIYIVITQARAGMYVLYVCTKCIDVHTYNICIKQNINAYITHVQQIYVYCIMISQDWFIEMEGKQNATKPWEDPVMLVEDIDQKGRLLQRETRYMISKLMNYASRPKSYGRYNTSRNNTRRNTTSKWSSPSCVCLYICTICKAIICTHAFTYILYVHVV